MPSYDLPESNRTRVWHKLRDLVLDDPTLSRVIETFVMWDGSKLVAEKENPKGLMPILRMVPMIGPQGWYSEDAIAGWLNIKVFMAIETREADDYLNLWGSFENVFYPPGDRAAQQAIQNDLQGMGCPTGLVFFSAPPMNFDPRQDADGVWAAEGEIRIEVYRTLNP